MIASPYSASAEVWLHLSYLGDTAVLLPCAVILAIWLLWYPISRGLGWRWVLTFLSVLAVVGSSKLGYMVWGIGIPALDFIGFSGHSALTATVWPTLLAILLDRWNTAGRRLGMGLGLFLCLLVGASRVALKVHSVAEVVAGTTLGLLALSVFWLRGTKVEWPHRKATLLWPIVLAFPFVYGHRFPSEFLLRKIAGELNQSHTVHTRRDLYVR